MKLVNIDEDIPEEFFIFVNRLNPVTRNNFDMTGTFTSAAFGMPRSQYRLPGEVYRWLCSIRSLPAMPHGLLSYIAVYADSDKRLSH